MNSSTSSVDTTTRFQLPQNLISQHMKVVEGSTTGPGSLAPDREEGGVGSEVSIRDCVLFPPSKDQMELLGSGQLCS